MDSQEEDSPFAEVRASVSNYDDPEMPCVTFRSMLLGILFSCLMGAINLFFYLRYPAPLITPPICQVLSYPLGKILAWALPTASWRTPRVLRRLGFPDEWSLNSGPFNIKEHTVIILMVNTSIAPAYALNYSLVAELWYDKPSTYIFDLFLLLSSQMIGFGTAGITRRFLVWPAGLIWPQNLVYCTLFNTLHAEDDDDESDGEKSVSRFRFFTYITIGAFIWYFVPGFLFQALSVFSFVCWAAPNNAVVNQLFGLSTGLGMSLLTFDWLQISYIGSPLVYPWWSEVNVFVGFFISYWVFTPIMYYLNVWYSAYLPISTSQVFDRFGSPYEMSRILDTVTLTLNETAYKEYSPVYLPMSYATVYCLAFALCTALITHTALYHGKDMWRQMMRPSNPIDEDVHSRLMRNYPEVPDWWYLIFLAVFTGVSILTVTLWGSLMPVWLLLLSLVVGFIYIIPGGFVFAMTSQQISINLIVELIAGYLMPGKPIANMLFKIYSAQPQNLAMQWAQDLKLGHYMKIPPRITFTIQIVAIFLSTLVQIGLKNWLLSTPDFCALDNKAKLICPTTRVFYSASIIWGLIGPERQFGPNSTYRYLLWSLLAGAVLPLFLWLLARRWPHSWVRIINIPVVLTGATYAPPATGINYSSWFLVGLIFQYWARKHHFRWWSKFNLVLSSALDVGTAVSTVFIFLTLQLPKGGNIFLNWWGNTVFENTADWNGIPYKTPPVEGFGPTSW
ncbi:OPT oligopeptide transporter [Meredithblackwellia eburnea MCA 4105]